MYEVLYHPEAAAELNRLRAFDRMRILNAIAKNLRDFPATVRGKKKRLDLGGGNFIWQLRVGDVFYDVLATERRVIVRHVRRKGRKSTGEIL